MKPEQVGKLLSRVTGRDKATPDRNLGVPKPEPVVLTRNEILRRVKEDAAVIKSTSSTREMSSRSRNMVILSSCLNAPGLCRFDASTCQYILPGDDILARDSSNERLTPRDIHAVMWRLNLQMHLTDDSSEMADISRKMLHFAKRL